MSSKGRVLIVSYWFPPSSSPGSLRASTFAAYWHRLGWNVSVLSARNAATERSDPSSLGRVPPEVRTEATASFEHYQSIHRHSSGRSAAASRSKRKSGLRRTIKALLKPFYQLTRFPDKKVGWTLPLIWRAGRIMSEGGIDVVFSSSPPHSSQFAMVILRKLRRFKWVVDFRDPWTAPSRNPKGAVSTALQKWMERTVLRNSDHIIANTEGNRRALLEEFSWIDQDKITVVTNGYDDVTPPEGNESKSVPSLDGCDIVYVGEVYPNMLNLFLDALTIIKETGPDDLPRVHVFGSVDERETRKVQERGLGKCFVYRGVVSWGTSVQVMNEAPSLLLLLPPMECWRTCVPSKLYPYLAAGRPVLAIVPPGDAADIVDATGAGTVLTDTDPRALADGIRAFVRGVHSGASGAGNHPDLVEQYAMSALASRVAHILSQLIAK